MKIAIITQSLKYNYGGILQNYALQQTLRSMGHDVETMEFLPGTDSIKGIAIALLKTLFFKLVDDKGRFLHIWKGLSSEQVLSTNTRGFIRKNIALRQVVVPPQESDYNAYIVGSDQVWRPQYSNLDVAYLDFAKKWKGIKRIAYAASFGTNFWEYTKEQTQKYQRLAKLFEGISVREASGVRLCKDYLDVTAIHVLDPTLLLDKEAYIKNLKLDTIPQSKGKLFYYFLDCNSYKEEVLRKLEKELDKEAFTINSKVEKKDAPLNERIQPPIEHWLRAFMDAEFIITDSFHGCVFSMIFNKPFAVVVNNKRGRARFDSLLNLFGQNYRMIDDSYNYVFNKSILNCPNIDIDSQRDLSISFLERALK